MDDVKRQVSEVDNINFKLLRDDVTDFMNITGEKYDSKDIRVLDIAPQDHAGAAPSFPKATIETLDISPDAGATYVADICKSNVDVIPNDTFDIIVCTEVLEHTLKPFAAVAEMTRILKPNGLILASTPFNFRIHGPRPDCWRFTEDGLRSLFDDFEIVELTALEDENRFLMPVHYTLIARKPS